MRRRKRHETMERYDTHRQESVLHPPPVLRAATQPALGDPVIAVLAEEPLVTVRRPRTHANHGASWQEGPAHRRALRRHNALVRQAEGWMQPAGLGDAGSQIRELSCLLPRSEFAQFAFCRRLVELGEQFVHGVSMSEKIVEYRPEKNRRGVAASCDVG